jgi:hypothetical protein
MRSDSLIATTRLCSHPELLPPSVDGSYGNGIYRCPVWTVTEGNSANSSETDSLTLTGIFSVQRFE